MDFRDYYLGLEPDKREAFSKRAGFSNTYVYTHLICVPPRKVPPLPKIIHMAKATNGKVTQAEMIKHFQHRQPREPQVEASTSA